MRVPGLACLLLAAACGDIQTVAGDAAPADAGPPDAREVGSITVTLGAIFGSSQPLAGHQVILVDPAGAIAADLTTGADGVATADDIEAGSTLVILIAEPPAGAPAGSQALVIVGVEPGDDIRFDPESRSGAAAGEMNVTWPQHPDAISYDVDTGCSSTNTNDLTTAMTFYQGCLDDGDARVLIRAIDGADGTVGWLGGTTTFTTPGAFDVPGPWTTPRPLEVNLSDIPAEARAVYPRLRPSRGEIPFGRVNLPEILLDAATVEVDLPAPTTFADSMLVTLDFVPNQPSFGANSLSQRVDPDAASVDLAVADELVPWYGAPLLDVPTRTFSWARSSGHELDAQFLAMFWEEKGTPASRFTLVMVPPDVTSVTVPELPSEYEPFMPANPADLGLQLQGGESSDVDGYRAARQTGFSIIYNTPVHGLEPPSTLRRSSGGDDF